MKEIGQQPSRPEKKRAFFKSKNILKLCSYALIITATCTPSHQALATGDGNLLFCCSYNESLNADIAQGEKEATGIGNTHLVEGKNGKGMTQEGFGKVSYSTAGNIKGEEGTIAMWVKPVNWSGKDNRFEFLFTVGNFPQQGKRHIQIYKYNTGGLYCLARNQDKKLLLQSNIANWITGDWHHLAFSWSKSDNICALYIDGEQVGKDAFDENILPTEDGHFGDAMHVNTVVNAENCDENDQTVVDDLYIYSRALNKQDIINLMGRSDKSTQ